MTTGDSRRERRCAPLAGSPASWAVDHVQADARDVAAVVGRARETPDFERPVALSLIALLRFIGDEDGAYVAVAGKV